MVFMVYFLTKLCRPSSQDIYTAEGLKGVFPTTSSVLFPEDGHLDYVKT